MNGHFCQYRWSWCVCTHGTHADGECPHCSCTIYELDDGTDVSPTRTGNPYGMATFPYNGKYSQRYANTLETTQ